ncbi:UvrD-helicase domain-containing protein [Rhizosaccharibacter radicis]|uniref:DNA 3'-5' helicase n=1 Tax=Rhizosaccharibacter radicis TaxID=2782605 RepID=A0ABT1W094_9PROT|nr:UvrD-helicase domain-containing protein [Acetobacteraceae bacterium KSS12]
MMAEGSGGTAASGAAEAVALANQQQGAASDPSSSVFVSASAGSGKTKLLIDRLLRLMLPRRPPGAGPEVPPVPGTNPARIQCLTFTKAAAAEMSIRLQRELGLWVTLDDAALDRRLRALELWPDASLRQAARALFARVLDLPGGMRIGTIHAFCQSLLRRFPVEAAISPQFRLIEETDSRMALNEALEAVLARQNDTPDGRRMLAVLAGQVSVGDLSRLVGMLQAKSVRLEPVLALASDAPDALRNRLRRAAGVRASTDADAVASGCAWAGEAALRAVLADAGREGPPGLKKTVSLMLDWLALPPDKRAEAWADWCDLFLTGDGEPRKLIRANTKLFAARSDIVDGLAAEAARIAAVEDERRGLRMVELSAAMLRLAAPVLRRYARGKRDGGFLDYDDLIGRTLELLKEPGSAWVLYKLDGGIDHLLLDEVQDTSPLQWEIAFRLSDEFFSGLGSDGIGGEERLLPRTVFAVGDYKQSIYSFQGADPDAFRFWHERFRQRVLDGAAEWRDPSLTVSFRSTTPVLSLVDAVFALPDARDGVLEPGTDTVLRHVSARPEQPGRVELWPLVPAVADDDEDATGDPSAGAGVDPADPWIAPTRNTGQATAPQRLADALAAFIASEIGRPGAAGAPPLAAGDVLVLVPRRSPFVRALVRALKTQGVPVASLVRSGLIDQVAVQDLLALCDVLLLPSDDLTLACVLTSPLGGLSDDDLMALAAGRGERSLWDSLQDRAGERPSWAAAWAFLSALFARVDYTTPHALLSEALGRHGGRARLLARLGPEAAEPVDELLGAALRHADSHPASLQGFLQWLRQSVADVKREAEAAGDAVRVMTAHGAKGLQARLVVMPDTTSQAPSDEKLLWTGADDLPLPLWVPRNELLSPPTRRLRDLIRDRARRESNRLLYVALTRAADRLVVCGWDTRKPRPADCWYELCRRGFEAAGAETQPFPGGWNGETMVIEHDQRPPASGSRGRTGAGAGIPVDDRGSDRAPRAEPLSGRVEGAAAARPGLLWSGSPEVAPASHETGGEQGGSLHDGSRAPGHAERHSGDDHSDDPGADPGLSGAGHPDIGAAAIAGHRGGGGSVVRPEPEPAPMPGGGAEAVMAPDGAPDAAALGQVPERLLPAWAGAAPDWRAAPPPAEPALPRPLAPSRPDDVQLGTAPALRSPLDAARPGREAGFRRGRKIHALLQHLPAVPPPERHGAALRFLSGAPDPLDAGEAASLAGRVMAVLTHPALAPLFGQGALAEQPVTGVVGGSVVTGVVDRMLVRPDEVLLCDFKTNRRPPSEPDRVPLLYLRQMGAYRALLRALFPGRAVRCSLVWTEEAAVMELPDGLLDAHAPGTYPRPA